jgi:hypothetical protein
MTVASFSDRLQTAAAGRPMSHCTASRKIQITTRPDDFADPTEDPLQVLATHGVEVFGSRVCSYQSKQVMLIVVEDGPRARLELEAAGFHCQNITPVVLVPLAGLLAKFELMSQLTKAGVAILYSYTFLPGAREPYLVLKTVDDDHALRIIESCAVQRAV